MYINIYILYITKFMFLGHRKMTQNVPCDHHVTILVFLFAYVECNLFVCCKIKFELI